ncbi:MAG: heparinase II/III family protein [Candidatus Jettenia sp.]|nr:MAG: heparinase II/III family protein [Candidatus Jettenia sp.]
MGDILCVSIICLLLSGFCYAAEIEQTHPRLISKIPQTKDIFVKSLKKEAKFYIPKREKDIVNKKGREREFVRLYCCLYFLEKNEKYFKKAKKLIDALNNAEDTKDDQQIRTRLQAYAYYYDLCFDKLDDIEKKRIQAKIINHIQWLDDNKYLKTNNFGGGHHFCANISALIGLLAIYHEEPACKEIFRVIEKNMKEGFLPFYKYLAEQDGGFHMWWEYSRYYIFWTCECFDVWRNATGEDLFRKNKWLENTFYFLLYGLRDDLTCWGTGDNHARGTGWIHRAIFEKIASEYRNGYAKYSANKLEKERKGWPGIDELVYDLLWKDDTVKPVSFENLPLVKAFERVGAYVFREGWKGDNVIALFKCTPIYFFNHSHRDANSFEIWYKGDLAIDSGYYDWYGSPHWFNYYIRSIAHNTVLIYDPNEIITTWDKVKSNDGGQRFSQWHHEQPYNVEDLKRKAFHVTDSQLLEDNEDYALAVGDATRAYSPHKCGQFKRYFVFLKRIENWKHPIIVVFDKVISTKQEYAKTWLLHSINKPKIEDNLITIVNDGGKLWCYVVQPDDFDIRLVGGKGREFEVNGINYPPDTTKKDDVEKWSGSWRVELRENPPQKETHYLNVLIPGEKSKANPPVVKKILNGVRIENWEVIYKDNELKVIKIASHEQN